MRISLLFCILSILVFSCHKKEILQTEPLADYYPLAVGKYVTYRLDSTVFTHFGTVTEVRSYEVKHVIESEITDNLGRTSYRVFRYLRDAAGTQPWTPSGSYFITPSANDVEVVEDNLRFIKLHSPIIQDFTWKGNKFLNSDPYNSVFPFSNDDYIADWDYYYENLNDTFTYNQQTLNGVLNIVQANDRFAIDTADVLNNKVTITKNSDGTYIRGSATDTIMIDAPAPDFGHESLTIYNRANFVASFNNILIPAGYSLFFQYYSDPSLNKWDYPNIVNVANNMVSLPNKNLVYIFGSATDNINVDVSQIDTSVVREITIYNRSDTDAYCNFNSNVSTISIPRGYGRHYELRDGVWIFYNNANVLLDNDPYSSDLAFGSTTYSVEKYAKNIGLVYKELIMWDFQPNPSGTPYKVGFGIEMWMVDHN